MEVQSGVFLDKNTQEAWGKLVASQKGKTRLRLSEPFVLMSSIPEVGVGTLIIPATTELMLFCNMNGSYKRPVSGRRRVTSGTFYLERLAQVSVMSDMSIKVTNVHHSRLVWNEFEELVKPQPIRPRLYW